MAEIDLSALQSQVKGEIDKLSDADVKKALLDLRVREKTTQKKQYGSDAAKKSAAKQREKNKLLKERAKALGIFDEIDSEAEAQAQTNFEQWKAEQPAEHEEA